MHSTRELSDMRGAPDHLNSPFNLLLELFLQLGS